MHICINQRQGFLMILMLKTGSKNVLNIDLNFLKCFIDCEKAVNKRIHKLIFKFSRILLVQECYKIFYFKIKASLYPQYLCAFSSVQTCLHIIRVSFLYQF